MRNRIRSAALAAGLGMTTTLLSGGLTIPKSTGSKAKTVEVKAD